MTVQGCIISAMKRHKLVQQDKNDHLKQLNCITDNHEGWSLWSTGQEVSNGHVGRCKKLSM